MLPYRCVSPQCAMPLCQSYTRFDACPVSCLRCMSPCSTPVLLLSLLSPGSRPVSAGSLCCKLVLALPDFKPTQAQAQAHAYRMRWGRPCHRKQHERHESHVAACLSALGRRGGNAATAASSPGGNNQKESTWRPGHHLDGHLCCRLCLHRVVVPPRVCPFMITCSLHWSVSLNENINGQRQRNRGNKVRGARAGAHERAPQAVCRGVAALNTGCSRQCISMQGRGSSRLRAVLLI